MPFEACYLVTTSAGQQVAHVASDQCLFQQLDLPNLCRWLAYCAEAIESEQGSVLQTKKLTIVMRLCNGLITAAVVPPSYILAETLFELQVLAVRIYMIGLRTAINATSRQLTKASFASQYEHQPYVRIQHLNLQQLRKDHETILGELRLVAEVHGILSVQLMQFDLLGDLSEVARLSAGNSCPTQLCLPQPHQLETAVKVACQILQSQLQKRRNRTENKAGAQPGTGCTDAKQKVTCAGIHLKQNGQPLSAAIKCVRLCSNCSFIIAWSKAKAFISPDIEKAPTDTAHVLIGKAAMSIDLQSRLVLVARALKRHLHVDASSRLPLSSEAPVIIA